MLAGRGRRCNQRRTRPCVLSWARMSPRRPLVALLALMSSACVPEPASNVEVRQTVAEIVDLGRAMTIEHAVVDLTTSLDPAPAPAAMAATLSERAAELVPCAEVTAAGKAGVRVDFGAPDAGCTYGGRGFSGALRVVFSEPTPGARLAAIDFVELVDVSGGGTTLGGTIQVTWGPDKTRRVITEVRLGSVDERQIEIQSDRVQRTYRGALQLDGWHRWQTLMGQWRMELGGWEFARGDLIPTRGLALISTPYDHEITLDFTGAQPDGLQLRANGGRVDRVYAVAADGEIVDLGDD